MDESSGDYESTATWKLHSDHSDKKTEFVGDIQGMVDNNPSKSNQAAFQKKMFVSEGGGIDNASLLFYGQSILITNFASRSSGSFFLSSSLQLITYSLVSVVVFVSEPTFMQQKFVYDVGLVSIYSAHKYFTFSRFSLASNLR